MAQTLGDWLAAEPFGLAMSSGFFSFFAHTGMLGSLTARGLRPNLVAGSSAGALVGGAWAAGLEPDALGDVLHGLRREDFWDPAFGVGLLAGRKFDALLRRILPLTEISACRVPTQISVFDIRARRTTVLRAGDLPDAIRASCCVPIMFHPVRIAGRAYWDGGVLDRPGLAEIPSGTRLLYHHISNRSPWRRAGAPSLEIPARAGMVTLVLDGLPRANPFRLDAGRRALDLARATTERALATPIVDGIVRLDV
jgi:NTE family protein